MRLDPKYFNLFIGVCAFFTVIVIIYGTLRYSKNQEQEFRANLSETDLSSIRFPELSGSDTLALSSFSGEPVVVDFWATWSDNASRMHGVIDSMKTLYPELRVISASVRDSQDFVETYINDHDYEFIFVQGTELFSDLKAPGIPSQFFIYSNGDLADVQVGEDADVLAQKIKKIVGN